MKWKAPLRSVNGSVAKAHGAIGDESTVEGSR